MSEELNENVETVENAEVNNEIVKDEKKKRDDFRKNGSNRRDRKPREEKSDFDKVLVAVRRVTKVVKGGRTMRFSALVVVGDRKGSVGIGTGKAKEVPAAIDKATMQAKSNMKKISIINGTIPHETVGAYGTSRVLMLPAKVGTGIIAGAAVRAVCEAAGIHDILTKSYGTSNAMNLVKAAIAGLQSVRSKQEVERLRGVSL